MNNSDKKKTVTISKSDLRKLIIGGGALSFIGGDIAGGLHSKMDSLSETHAPKPATSVTPKNTLSWADSMKISEAVEVKKAQSK